MTADEILGLLRDTAQGASNSAASTVSAPVDVLAWLLRKGGVPVGPAPVLGSDWMAQKGLTAQPKNALAGMAGETIGNILPIVAPAKAPQIANALMRADEALTNQLGPTIANAAEQYMAKTGMMQPATVWHGSPHKFDKFDASKIGTGEGAQAYGHGLYFADAPETAASYRGSVTKFDIPDGPVKGISTLIAARGDEGERLARQAYGADFTPAQLEATIAQAKQIVNEQSHLYKVDLPDSAIARMLDWDKPLSQQAPEVQAALRKQGISGKEWDIAAVGDGPRGYLNDRFVFDSAIQAREELNALRAQGYTARPLKPESATLTVQDLVKGQNQDIYAERLRKAGIPGIRYLDGGSRGAGAGTSNYVIFPGNENLLRILERNGVPIGN